MYVYIFYVVSFGDLSWEDLPFFHSISLIPFHVFTGFCFCPCLCFF